jgi:hypothetical protein
MELYNQTAQSKAIIAVIVEGLLTKDDLKVARLNRQRLAAEDGARAMEEAAKKDADVRVNMARLRELRLAKEAQEARSSISTSDRPATAKLKKRVR